MITKRFSACQTAGSRIESSSVVTSAFILDPDLGLTCDGVPLADVAAHVGTPTFVYSAASIRSAWRRFDAAFAGVPHTLHYALKANSRLAVLRLLGEMGSGADANSGGEIDVAMRAGFTPDRIVFTGVGKTREELDRAVALGVKAINAESLGELERIDAIARARGVRARVALRVNPDIEAGAHPHISTGRRINKFGVPIDLAREHYRRLAGMAGLQPIGVHAHIGSQITDVAPLRQTAEAIVEVVRQLTEDGVALEHVDLGGGLGVSYDGTAAPTPDDYAAAVLPVVGPTGLTVLLEPGRVIVAQSAVLLARVIDVKQVLRRPPVRDPRRRDDRAHPSGALRGVPPHRSRQAAAGRRARHGGRRAALREQRRRGQEPEAAAARGRRPRGRARRRRLRLDDGFHLQPASPALRGNGGRRAMGGHQPAADG